jgi:hypothetical protein
MAPITTQTSCPNCNNLVQVTVDQLYDNALDSNAKSKLLSGQFNLIQCQNCNYSGNMASPIVYHDPEKELLMSFVPHEMNMSRDDQERIIGRLIKEVTDNLPQEERKGYLFNPQQAFTLQGLVEKILLEDGITKEMLDAQQKKVGLIQKLAEITDEEALEKLAVEEDETIDREFFGLLTQLIENTRSMGDQNTYQRLVLLEKQLLPITTIGKELQTQSAEVQTAIDELNELGEGLTREALLDLVVNAPNEIRVSAYVNLARPGMDYEFFQKLSEMIDNAEGDETARLSDLRAHILKAIDLIDEQTNVRMEQASKNLEILLDVEDIKAATLQNIGAIDNYFMHVLEQSLEKAKNENNYESLGKLQTILDTLQEAAQQLKNTSGAEESEFIEKLLQTDEADQLKLLQDNEDKVTPKFVEIITGLMVQAEQGADENSKNAIKLLYQETLKISMKSNLQAE